MPTRTIFCANCQATTEHQLEINQQDPSEVLATCTNENCGRFHKLPKSMTAEEFAAYCQSAEEANKGQVNLDREIEKLQF